MWSDGEPIDPSSTADQAVNGGFPWLEIQCARCTTPSDVDLAAMKHPPTTAKSLGVNHATVLRLIAQFEERLGAHVFEKLPSGYRLTAAGEEVLELANQMEATSHQLETRVFGRDQSVRGLTVPSLR